MNRHPKRFLFVVSTGGSVMNTVLHNAFVRSQVHSVVFDYEDVDTRNLDKLGVHCEKIVKSDIEGFCHALLLHCEEHKIDYVLSYYTRFYSKIFRDTYRNRVINFHPSLLPAFKGMDGFGDAVKYHSRFAGNTVELIDEVMDEGKIVMQTVCPIDLRLHIRQVRHTVFIQQCKALIQTVCWLCEGRVKIDGRRVLIEDASFNSHEYSPALDCVEAMEFEPGITD